MAKAKPAPQTQPAAPVETENDEHIGIAVFCGGAIKQYVIPVDEVTEDEEDLMSNINGYAVCGQPDNAVKTAITLRMVAALGLLTAESLETHFLLPEDDSHGLTDDELDALDEHLDASRVALGQWADYEVETITETVVVYAFGMA